MSNTNIEQTSLWRHVDGDDVYEVVGTCSVKINETRAWVDGVTYIGPGGRWYTRTEVDFLARFYRVVGRGEAAWAKTQK